MTLLVKLPVKLSLKYFTKTSITQTADRLPLRYTTLVSLLTVSLFALSGLTFASGQVAASELEQFKSAWAAAKKGDHFSFNQIKSTLQGYVLFPYLQYEDYRNRRAKVPVDEMADFLETHQDWAFSPGLRNAWLKSLGKKGRWADLVAHSEGVSDIVLRCQRARGQIILKQTTQGLFKPHFYIYR